MGDTIFFLVDGRIDQGTVDGFCYKEQHHAVVRARFAQRQVTIPLSEIYGCQPVRGNFISFA
jgi:hypothetical protein